MKKHNKISFFEMHFAKYPVIYLPFNQISGRSYAEIMSDFDHLIGIAFRKFAYIKNDDNFWKRHDKSTFDRYYYWDQLSKLESSTKALAFRYLAEILFYYHEETVFVIFDEFDAPISVSLTLDDSISEQKTQNIFNFCHKILGSLIKNKPHFIKKAILTNILSTAALESAYANNSEMNFIPFLKKEQYSSIFGLTQGNVDLLLQKFNMTHKRNKTIHFYNGYPCGSKDIYNVYSIIRSLKARAIKPYWASMQGNEESILRLCIHPYVRPNIENLLQGGVVNIEGGRIVTRKSDLKNLSLICDLQIDSIETPSKQILFNYMLELGILTTTKNSVHELRIPNFEIKKNP